MWDDFGFLSLFIYIRTSVPVNSLYLLHSGNKYVIRFIFGLKMSESKCNIINIRHKIYLLRTYPEHKKVQSLKKRPSASNNRTCLSFSLRSIAVQLET